VLASHVYCREEFWMTTGAALPVIPEVFDRLTSDLNKKFGGRPEDYRNLTPEQETEMATRAIRFCLAQGMSERVRYGETTSGRETTSGPHFGQTPSLAPAVGPIGRNDPCPCGSGRKYKHCCRR
jgi:uncharacterized protein YecA (UPF0149 family)